jgi:hypothetical protein
MVGRLTTEPFSLVSNQCKLNCATGYWSNWQSNYNPSVDPLDQRCTYDNCKNWNYDEYFWTDIDQQLQYLYTHNFDIFRDFDTTQLWTWNGLYTSTDSSTSSITDVFNKIIIRPNTKIVTLEGLYNNNDLSIWRFYSNGTLCWYLENTSKYYQGHIQKASNNNN